jgi:transcriptional regulator with XRE-family HTH domain
MLHSGYVDVGEKQMDAELGQLSIALRDARLAVGLTQAELAKEAGVSRSSVARFESAQGFDMSLSAVARLFGACGLKFSLGSPSQSGRNRLSSEYGSEKWPDSRVNRETAQLAFSRAAKTPNAATLEAACQRWLQFAQYASPQEQARFQQFCVSNYFHCLVYRKILEQLLQSARRYPEGTSVTELLTWHIPFAPSGRRYFQVGLEVRERLKEAIQEVARSQGDIEELSVEIATCGFFVDANNPILPPEIDLARLARTTDGSSFTPVETTISLDRAPAYCNLFVTYFFRNNVANPKVEVDELMGPDLFAASYRDECFPPVINFGTFIAEPEEFRAGFSPLLDLAHQSYMRGEKMLDDVVVYDVNSRKSEPEIHLHAYCAEKEAEWEFLGIENLRYDIVLEVYENGELRKHLHLARTTTPALAVGVIDDQIRINRPRGDIVYRNMRPKVACATKR